MSKLDLTPILTGKAAASQFHCIVRCHQCDCEFSIGTADLRRGRGLFCSRACSGKYRAASLEQRFWAKVKKTDTCWLWTGYTTAEGYGQIQSGNGEGVLLAHRVSWELHFGPLADGMNVCHDCDNPPCIRPDHLFEGTQKDNMADAALKGRIRNQYPEMEPTRGSDHWNAKLTEDQVVEILNLRNQGLSYAKIAERYAVIPQYIGEICRGETWTHISRPVVSFTDALRKLTRPQVVEILQRLKLGERQAALAREFGVDPATIQSIVAYKSWRDVPRP
jgi:uncharacterized protein (DUF433 family)